MKICTKCNKEKEDINFSFKNKLKGTLQSQCKSCVKERDKNSYSTNERKLSIRKAAKNSQKKLREHIDNIRKNGSCSNCKEDRWYVLDFHHTRDKIYSIANSLKRCISINKLQEELDKCILLCSNCHRELHYKERLVDNPSD